MKTLSSTQRRVRNVYEDAFEPFDLSDKVYEDIAHITIDPARAPGTGFHAFKMAPGTNAAAHEHVSHEHFFVLEGDLQDHDGYKYRAGDLVQLTKGSQHSAYTASGCTLVCYIDEFESMLDEEE